MELRHHDPRNEPRYRRYRCREPLSDEVVPVAFAVATARHHLVDVEACTGGITVNSHGSYGSIRRSSRPPGLPAAFDRAPLR